MKTRQRLPEVKEKNNIVLIIVTSLTWISLAGVIYFVSPDAFAIIPIFFALLFVALFLTVLLIIKNKKQGLLISSALVFFLLLRYLGIGNILNLILIGGIVVAIEIFLASR